MPVAAYTPHTRARRGPNSYVGSMNRFGTHAAETVTQQQSHTYMCVSFGALHTQHTSNENDASIKGIGTVREQGH